MDRFELSLSSIDDDWLIGVIAGVCGLDQFIRRHFGIERDANRFDLYKAGLEAAAEYSPSDIAREIRLLCERADPGYFRDLLRQASGPEWAHEILQEAFHHKKRRSIWSGS